MQYDKDKDRQGQYLGYSTTKILTARRNNKPQKLRITFWSHI